MIRYIPLLMLFIGINAHSQTVDSLQYYLEQAATNNALVKSDFTAYQASLQKTAQAGAYPDPTLEMGFFLKPMAQVNGNEVAEFKLMQMFPWFGTQGAAKSEASHMAKMAFEKFRDTRDNLFLDVYKQWFTLCNMQQQLKNSQENRLLLSNLENLAINKSKTKLGSMSDILRIQLEEAELDNSIVKLKADIKAAKGKFNALLNRSIGSKVNIPNSLEQVSIAVADTINANTLNNNPMLGMIHEQSLAYESKLEMDKKMSYPMFGLGVNYMLVNKAANPIGMSNMNGMDMIMPMVSISIPIFRKKYNAQQKEGRYLQQSSQERYTDTQNQLQAQYFQLKTDLENATRAIALYQKQNDLASTTYKIIVNEFAAGKSDLSNVIAVERQLLTYQLKESEAIANYNVKVAELQKLISK